MTSREYARRLLAEMTEELSPDVLTTATGQPPQRSGPSSWLRRAGFGCSGVLLVSMLLCAGCGMWLWRGKVEVDPVAAAFLAAADRGDDAKNYRSLGDEWKKIQTEEQFAGLMQRLRELLGPLKSKRSQGIFRTAGRHGPIARVTYIATYTKGTVTVTLTLTKVSQAWKVIACHWDTPLVQQALKCSHCGAMNATLGQFCASCGKPMTAQLEQKEP